VTSAKEAIATGKTAKSCTPVTARKAKWENPLKLVHLIRLGAPSVLSLLETLNLRESASAESPAEKSLAAGVLEPPRKAAKFPVNLPHHGHLPM